jgi:ABC-2 type transport system permease protein
MKPLLYLALCRFKNSLRRMVKTPRLLLPGCGLVFAFGGQILLHFLRGSHGASSPPTALMPTDMLTGGPGALVAAVKGILLLSIFTAVINSLGEGGLFFVPSDVDFLFPAPLTRRAVLLFKMFGRYSALLFPAFYLPLVASGSANSSAANFSLLAYLPGCVGCWLFLVAITNTSQSVLLARPPDDGTENEAHRKRREKVKRVFTFLLITLIVGAVYLLIHSVSSGEGTRDLRKLLRFVNSETGRLIVLPISWAAELFYIPYNGWTPGDYGRLGGLLALAAGSFVLLFSRDRDFYEASHNLSDKRTRMTKAAQSGDAGAILTQMAQDGKLARGRSLQSFGGGARAVLWRDMVATTRTPLRSWITLFVLAAIPALLGMLLGSRRSDVGVLIWTVLFTLQISGLFLLSLRDMLRRADISKALPISPARFLLAELTLSIVQLTVLGWFSLTVMALTSSARGSTVMIAALSLPSLATLLLLVQASFVLLYPQPSDPAQNAVSGLLSAFASIVSLTPAIIIGVLLWTIQLSPLLLAASITVTNLIAAMCALFIAAFLWQRFDPTD